MKQFALVISMLVITLSAFGSEKQVFEKEISERFTEWLNTGKTCVDSQYLAALLKRGAQPDITVHGIFKGSRVFISPLKLAAILGDYEFFTTLLESGASVNYIPTLEDSKPCTNKVICYPVLADLIAAKREKKFYEALNAYGASELDVNLGHRGKPLNWALALGDSVALEFIISAPSFKHSTLNEPVDMYLVTLINEDSILEKAVSPLGYAAKKRDLEIMEILADNGADPTYVYEDKHFGTANLIALATHPEAAVKLIELGADVKMSGRVVNFSWSCENISGSDIDKYVASFKEYVQLGAPVSTVGVTDNPLRRLPNSSFHRGCLEMLKFFVKNFNFDLTLPMGISGGTPLHDLARSREWKKGNFYLIEGARFLLANGADKSLKDSKGKTPYQLARMLGNHQLAAILK